jgi:hypothetical protein
MACIQCGNDVRVGGHGMCPSCGRKAGKEVLETLKNSSSSQKKAAVGAAAGAAIGSVVPVIGTTVGFIVGGFIGGVFGSKN